ncbi:hypothetical protein VTN02DRAFT_4506 [Thermoascus thermophilus]
MGKIRSRLYKTDRARDFDHEQIYETIDRQPFQWTVVLVAGVGFFLDGYTLFASNIALPMIAYVYWRDEATAHTLAWINVATLTGTLVGQVVGGVLADKVGRKRMYGLELTLLIMSTLGVVMASTGVHHSMSIVAWLIWWRFMGGIGVGADYPLSAVITSEFAPTKHRARMMAAVFFMQPLGQIAGNVVSLITVAASRRQTDEDPTRAVDIMWRWVIGIGVVPGVVALLFRVAIPETPRFLLEIEDDPVQAEFDATALFGEETVTQTPSASPDLEPGSSWSSPFQLVPSGSSGSQVLDDSPERIESSAGHPATLNSHWRLAAADMGQYFWTEGNWRTLAGTALAWLLLDFGFYGIGLSSPQFLARTWGTLHLHPGPAPPWQTDSRPDASVHRMFMDTSIHAMVILNAGSCLGGLLLIAFADRLDRVALQKYGFLALAALFVALGTLFVTVHLEGPVAVVLYFIGQTLFNFGPNGTTYILPAEVFPTRYRGTCHGLSAGAGKIGSILVQVLSAYYSKLATQPGDAQTTRHGWVLIVFSGCMVLGAAVTHVWIPSVQRAASGASPFWGGQTQTLETLALGRMGGRSRYAVRTRSVWGVGVAG